MKRVVILNFEQFIQLGVVGWVFCVFFFFFDYHLCLVVFTFVQTHIPQNLPGRTGQLVLEGSPMEGTKNILNQHQSDI